MQSKPQPRKWTDVQVVIAALALTLTLGYWNLFSDSAKKSVPAPDGSLADSSGAPAADPVAVAASGAPAWTPNVKIFLGGGAPGAASSTVLQPSNVSSSVSSVAAKPASKKHKGSGAVTQTKSS